MRLELGCGNHPKPGYLHHDAWQHSPHVDIAFPLDVLPWPLRDGEFDVVLATDVFEHLPPWKVSIQEWLDECWRILEPGGLLNMRLPSFQNPYTWRDPTHYRPFHQESFLYWCPDAPGTVWKDFGRYYFGPDYAKWWHQEMVAEEAGDLRFRLRKCATS